MDAPDDMLPRELSAREHAWMQWLLPSDRPGYKRLADRIRPLCVIGEGRWGKNDLVLGEIGGAIDLTEGMQSVAAFGSITGTPCNVTLTLHQPNDAGQIEFQISPSSGERVPPEFTETCRWTYSTWSPGDACPATGTPVREVPLPTRRAGFRLVIAPQQRVMWLHDPEERVNQIIPVSGFYNELVIGKGIRDPKIALNHALLFSEPERFADADIVDAFKRYNVLYKKIGIALFDSPPERHASVWEKLFGRKAR